VQLLKVKFENRPVRDNNVAAILKAPGIRIAPLATKDPIKEATVLIKLAVKDIYEIIDSPLALEHEVTKVLEGNFRYYWLRFLLAVLVFPAIVRQYFARGGYVPLLAAVKRLNCRPAG